MIKILKSVQEIGLYNLPFLVFTPKAREAYDISVRVHDKRWPSLRFRVKLSGKEIRIKQFFLDWFFLGFPKSMMKDFASGYSNIRSRDVDGFSLFLGKNYRKNDAAAAWIHGTMIEMDCYKTVSDDEYELLLMDLIASSPNKSRLEKFQFPDRSHFAKGYESDWYEDRRIARLSWRRTGPYTFKIGDMNFLSSGLGYIQADGQTQEIFVFQENQYAKAIWIELVTPDVKIPNALYDVRKGDGLFDTELQLPDNKGMIIFRTPTGPGVIQIPVEQHIMTVGFSPGLSLKDISSFLSKLGEVLSVLREINESVPHRDANL